MGYYFGMAEHAGNQNERRKKMPEVETAGLCLPLKPQKEKIENRL